MLDDDSQDSKSPIVSGKRKEFILKHRLTVERLEVSLFPAKDFDFTCTICGHCCEGGGNVYFSEIELENVFKHLKIPEKDRDRFKMKFIRNRENGYFVHSSSIDCYFLQKGQCVIYPVRPLQCRTYPFWPSCFASTNDVKKLKKECRGALKGNGKIYSFLSTVRRTNKTMTTLLKEQTDDDQLFML